MVSAANWDHPQRAAALRHGSEQQRAAGGRRREHFKTVLCTTAFEPLHPPAPCCYLQPVVGRRRQRAPTVPGSLLKHS